MRSDVEIPSGSERLSAWWYLPDSAADAALPPVIVMAHGLGGVKEMRLDAFADRFVAAGYAALVFDYRHFGASTGQPRQLLDIGKELEDWRAALTWVRARDDVDTTQVVLWGTSFGGGHVIQTAAQDGHVAAVIAQCPFTDGFASARAGNPVSTAKVTALAVADLAAATLRSAPILVTSAGPPGSAALMNGPDCEAGYLALVDNAPTFRNQVSARFALAIARHFPGRLAKQVNAPIYFAICETDTVAPAKATRRHAARAPRGEIHLYPCGHFDIYVGDAFEQAVNDYVDFLARHVPVA